MAELADSVRESRPTVLTTGEKERVLVATTDLIARLEALRGSLLASADDVAESHGARSAAAWLAHETRHDPPAGRRWQRLADGLDDRWPVLAAAYADGSSSTAQVQVIGKALDDLPAGLDPDLRRRAEEHLVAQAAHFAPRDLRLLGRRILDVVAPEIAEAHEAKLVEREEQAAWDEASLTHRRLGNGLSRAVVTLPDSVMDRLLTQLHAFASPRRQGAVPRDERVPHPTRLAHAFSALLERIPVDWLPTHGSTSASIVVTIDHDKLTQDLATAGLAKRLFSSSQRKAMAIRDQQCRAEGCDARHSPDTGEKLEHVLISGA